MKPILAGILATLVCATTMCLIAAAAGQPATNQSLVIASVDVDHDGVLNWDEVSAAAMKKFRQLDVDHDGMLDPIEMTGIMTHDEFVAADSDKDGMLNPAEYLAYAKQLFNAAAVSGDGLLNSADLSTASGVKLVSLIAY